MVLSVIAALALAVVLAANVSGPIFSDELQYIDVGLKNTPASEVGNRFWHIYMQKAFMSLAPTPLVGVKAFWAFLIVATAWMVYWNARNFAAHSHALHGMLAVAIFFGYRMIAQYAGDTSVDISAMFMVTVLLSLYLLYLRVKQHQSYILFALGAVVFLSFKTKEPTLFANVLLLGLLFDQQGRFSLQHIKDLYRPLLGGFVAAIALFIVLDGITLGNPFFALQPATFQAVFKKYAYTGGFRMEPVSWYTTYLLDGIAVPFLLFLLSGAVLAKELTMQKKLLWAFPFVLLAFVTLNMLKIPWGFIERFYFPALPAIAILAPQFLRFELPKTKRAWLLFALVVLTVLVGYALLRFAVLRYVVSIDWDYAKFLETILFPILLSVLLVCIIWEVRWKLVNVALPLFCLFWLLLSPLTYTYKYIFSIPFTGQIFERLYYPLTSMQEHIPQRSDVSMYVSAALHTEQEMLSDNLYEVIAMYNLLFDQRVSRDQIRMAYRMEEIPAGITSGAFAFALLTKQEWEYLQGQEVEFSQVQERYTAHWDPQELFVLLVAK